MKYFWDLADMWYCSERVRFVNDQVVQRPVDVFDLRDPLVFFGTIRMVGFKVPLVSRTLRCKD